MDQAALDGSVIEQAAECFLLQPFFRCDPTKQFKHYFVRQPASTPNSSELLQHMPYDVPIVRQRSFPAPFVEPRLKNHISQG